MSKKKEGYNVGKRGRGGVGELHVLSMLHIYARSGSWKIV